MFRLLALNIKLLPVKVPTTMEDPLSPPRHSQRLFREKTVLHKLCENTGFH